MTYCIGAKIQKNSNSDKLGGVKSRKTIEIIKFFASQVC